MKKSFTLIEVLISVFLFTLLIATAMIAFKTFIGRINYITYKIPEKAVSYEILNRNIEGLYPYYIKTNNKINLFFKLDKNYVSYISLNSIFFNKSVISKIRCENNSLVYYESPLYDKLQNYNNPVILKNKMFRKVLFKNIKKCEIKATVDELPILISINIDNIKMIFSPLTTWKNLNKILKLEMEHI